MRILEPHGALLITFKSTRSVDCGHGRRLDDMTWVHEGGIEHGIPHYFVDEPRIRELLRGFDVERLEHRESETERGRNAHWIVSATKS